MAELWILGEVDVVFRKGLGRVRCPGKVHFRDEDDE